MAPFRCMCLCGKELRSSPAAGDADAGSHARRDQQLVLCLTDSGGKNPTCAAARTGAQHTMPCPGNYQEFEIFCPL